MRVIILQGVPGSGKSSFASTMTAGPDPKAVVTVVSADLYFTDPETGEYRFKASDLGKAHAFCMRNFIAALQNPRTKDDVVVVDNTNITTDQMAPYYLVARAFGCSVRVVRILCEPEVAAQRNTHGVPRATVLRMARTMEDPPRFWDATFHKC